MDFASCKIHANFWRKFQTLLQLYHNFFLGVNSYFVIIFWHDSCIMHDSCQLLNDDNFFSVSQKIVPFHVEHKKRTKTVHQRTKTVQTVYRYFYTTCRYYSLSYCTIPTIWYNGCHSEAKRYNVIDDITLTLLKLT